MGLTGGRRGEGGAGYGPGPDLPDCRRDLYARRKTGKEVFIMELSKHRFEFFSDGVMAIIMTIMVLEIPVPLPFSFESIFGLMKSLLIFFVSFFIVGGFLYKHHRLIDGVTKITPKIIWRNFVFLFFVALLPIFTKMVLENADNTTAIILYDINFLLANISFLVLACECGKQAHGEYWEAFNSRRNGAKSGTAASIRFIASCAALLGMIVLSLFFPKFSLVMYIVFPLLFNFLNIFSGRISPEPPCKRQGLRTQSMVKAVGSKPKGQTKGMGNCDV